MAVDRLRHSAVRALLTSAKAVVARAVRRHRHAVRAWGACAVVGILGAGAAGGCAARRTQQSVNAESTSESPADKHYDVAVGSFHNAMFEDAKLQLDRALRADPEHADSHYLQGVLLLNEGKSIVDAIEIEQCLVDAAADHQRSRAEELHRKAGQAFERAAKLYEEGAAGRGRALNSLAVVSLFFHQPERASQHARDALEQQFYTDRYSALSNMGWAHYRSGDAIAATAELRQAILINPDYCVGHYRLAQVYLDSGLPEQALEHAQAVVDSPRCPIQDAHRILGVARLRLGQDEGAAHAFQACVDVAPRSCLARDCKRLAGEGAGANPTMAQSRSVTSGDP